jgi:hypothetical protein
MNTLRSKMQDTLILRGFSLVLHTWTQSLLRHLQVHALVNSIRYADVKQSLALRQNFVLFSPFHRSLQSPK